MEMERCYNVKRLVLQNLCFCTKCELPKEIGKAVGKATVELDLYRNMNLVYWINSFHQSFLQKTIIYSQRILIFTQNYP